MPRKAPTGRVSGLFYTKLDTQQTKLHEQTLSKTPTEFGWKKGDAFDHSTRGLAYQIQPADPIETAFRHRDWLSDRSRVRKALVGCGRPKTRLDRFDACGADCVVQISGDGKDLRLRANYCGDRWCTPCMRARAAIVKDRLIKLIGKGPCAFTTLTLRRDDLPLADRRNRLLHCFAKLRRTKFWTRQVRAGAYCVQITRGSNGDHWHVHLHCIHTGTRLHKHGLSDAWKSTTRDSWVVDSQDVEDVEKQAAYVARYAAKGCEPDVVQDPEALLEAVASLAGARMLATFGEWRGVDFDRDDQDKTEWRSLGLLRSVAVRAASGEPWAIGVLRGLRVRIEASRSGFSFKSIPIEEGRSRAIGRHPDG